MSNQPLVELHAHSIFYLKFVDVALNFIVIYSSKMLLLQCSLERVALFQS